MSLTQIKNPPFMRAPISSQPIDLDGWQTVKVPAGLQLSEIDFVQASEHRYKRGERGAHCAHQSGWRDIRQQEARGKLRPRTF